MASRLLRNNKAFSLIEVIVSVAILSLGISQVIRAMSFSAQATGLSCDMISALMLAKDKLQEYEFLEYTRSLATQPRQISVTSGKFNTFATLDQDPDSKIYTLSCDISWMRTNKSHHITIRTLLQ